jgi:hypothetical protein
MQSRHSASTSPLLLVLATVLVLATTACGGPSTPTPEVAAPVPEAAPAADATESAVRDEAAAAEEAALVAAREQELKAKELELELRERDMAAKEAAAAAARPKAPPKTAAAPKPVEVAQAQAQAQAPAAAPPPPPVTVPAGTALTVKLNSDYSTKTAAVGQAVNAELASDLMVDGRLVARAGAPISGTVTEVTSGSRKIGAVPALKIDFTQLVVADGGTMPVAIRVNQKGQSEKGRDTAKIAGGTAAGAIIGHQIDDDKGKVIGGIIGGAAGAIGASKTGTEVEIAAGSLVPASVRTGFTYDGR